MLATNASQCSQPKAFADNVWFDLEDVFGTSLQEA
jgi:hypothetical protein